MSVAILAQVALGPCRPWPQGFMGKRGSLLEAAFKDERVKAARVCRQQSVERAVQKCIVDNFKGFSDAEVDGIQHDGLTLRQRLLRDKTDKDASGKQAVVTGARYYRELRNLYSSNMNPIKQLIVTDESTPRSEVFNAMLAAKRPPINRNPLINYLTTAENPNMSEVIGILKWCLELNPLGSACQLRGVMEVMRWVTRCELETTYSKQLAHLKAKFNEALVQVQLYTYLLWWSLAPPAYVMHVMYYVCLRCLGKQFGFARNGLKKVQPNSQCGVFFQSMHHLVYWFVHAPLYRNQAYTVFRSSMKGPSEWLTSHKDMWALVLPVAQTTKLLEAPAESSWKDHAAEIQDVVASGPLGSKLFGFALKLILAELVEEVIEREIQAMLKHENISNEVFMTAFRQAKADVANISGIDALPGGPSQTLG
jgi:hypothetical protein